MGFATLQSTVHLGGLAQEEGLAESDLETAVRDPLLQVAAGGVPALERVSPKPESTDPETPAIEFV